MFHFSYFMFHFSFSVSWTEMIWWVPRVSPPALWRCTKHSTAHNVEMTKLKMNYWKRKLYFPINQVANEWSVSFTCHSFSYMVLINPMWAGLSFHLSFCLPVNEMLHVHWISVIKQQVFFCMLRLKLEPSLAELHLNLENGCHKSV